MGRKPDGNRLQEIGRFVESHPGSRPIDVARGLGVAPSSITRSLPALEDAGILLSEDDLGCLWPFGKRRR